MDFPTLRDGTFPHIDNVDVYQYKNEYDYSRFDADQAHITVCHVPWDVGLVHVGDRFIEGLGNVVKFADETERNAYISGLSDKFEFDTKYRRYHLELEIKLPIPVDRCAEYNYVAVHHEPIPNASDPVEYESATEGVKDWFFFIRELKYLAPNTTYAVLMLDVWQTFIYRFGISGVMLERGHFPMSQSDTDAFLSDPMANSAFLLDPDIDASESSISASDDVHVFDDDVLFALFTSFDFAGSYGVKHRNGWSAPSIGIVGKSGYPTQTCIAVEITDAQSLLDYMRENIPQALECVQACAFVPRELVEVSGTFVLASLTVYNLAGKKSTIAHELSRVDYAYPSQYAELAKLYTSPYASIVITDGADKITIAPQTVSGNTIEIITDLQLIADALRMRSQTVHAGGSNISLGFERLTSKTFTVSGSIQDLSILRDIPTYSIYVDNRVIYDNGNYWLNEQRKAEAAAQLADATDRATATKADAYASALASKDNAYASALTSKDNAYASAQTANANAYEQAQAQNMIDLANAATTKADAVASAYASLNDATDNADTAKTNADAAALADKQNADASAWAEQTNSNASALADKQNADSNAWAEQTNSNASALADYTNRNSSAFAVKTDADEEGNTKTANAALNVAANSLINSYATTDATSQANYNISYNALALAADNGYTNDTANAQADAQIQSAAVSVAGNAIGAAATGAMAGSVIPGVGTVAGAVAGIISAVPNAAEVAANTAIGVNLSVTQAGLAIANASSKESSANTTMSSKTATSNYYSTASTDAGNNLITDTTANEAALIQANAQRDYACDIDNSQRTYDTEVNNATNTYSAETSNAQNTYDTLVNNATNTYSAETSNAQNTYNIRTQSNTRDNDTAHAIADRDYSIAIGIANRDNTTAIDNADLAKLTAESIADRSQATDNANADRSYAAATGNADRSYAAATGNADRDYNTSIGVAQRDNTVQLAAIDADIAQAALKAPYAVCAGSVQNADAETPNFLDIQIRTMQPSDIRRIGDEFLRFGYAYHGYVAEPDFTIMPRFTFWQCSEIFISNLSIPDAYADQIRYLLIGGVTVWSDPSFIGNTSIYDNVIGG